MGISGRIARAFLRSKLTPLVTQPEAQKSLPSASSEIQKEESKEPTDVRAQDQS